VGTVGDAWGETGYPNAANWGRVDAGWVIRSEFQQGMGIHMQHAQVPIRVRESERLYIYRQGTMNREP
jgi:hypothetical protein